MLTAFQIDFAAYEFAWALLGGLILTFVMRGQVRQSHRMLHAVSHCPWIPALVLAGVMLVVQIGVATRFGWPIPALHDEFSYLLAADTYASGRATNPTHPAWEFLETYHILWHPTYQSKYPPGNGLVLALGQVLTGRPIVGIWVCLAVSAIMAFWMLKGWFSTVWAVLGTGILIGNWPITKLWGQTYYGGTPALLGGLLVFGAAARLLRRSSPRPINVCWLGVGLVVLMITRPYEGLLASLPVLVLLAVRMWTAPQSEKRNWWLRVILPVSLILASGFLALAWYHMQVTGSPWTWPYRLYESTYSRRTNPFNTILSFTELGPRERTIPSLEYESSAAMARIAESKPIVHAAWKVVRQWWVHIGLLATLPFCLACFRCLGKSSSRIPFRWAMCTIGLVGIAILLQRTAGHPHYAAPIQPLILILIIQGLRLLRTAKLGVYRIGGDLVSWFTWSLLLFFLLPLVTGTNRPGVRAWSLDRARIQSELEQRPRPQLVIVQYGPKHSMHEEWVYNRADIDRAQVVWARDLGVERNMQLLDRFPGREVSLVRPDVNPIAAIPYQSVKVSRVP